eukprot:gene5141-5789_t
MVKISFRAAYGGIALFISLLNNIFLLYYVNTFVNIYKIDSKSFWIGEAIFLLWNSLNDPLFGWLSDRKSLSISNGDKSLSYDIVLKRIRYASIHDEDIDIYDSNIAGFRLKSLRSLGITPRL